MTSTFPGKVHGVEYSLSRVVEPLDGMNNEESSTKENTYLDNEVGNIRGMRITLTPQTAKEFCNGTAFHKTLSFYGKIMNC